jgi:hypothetical protein
LGLIEQIGAYAGLAAIPGLAILSALYFSQARDVRRLREWAGRAPERAAEHAEGGRVATQQAAQPAAQPAAAAAQPAAAAGNSAPAAAGAKPAAATPAAAGAAAAKASTPAEQVAAAKHAAAARVAASTAGAGAASAQAPAGANASASGTATADEAKPAEAAAASDAETGAAATAGAGGGSTTGGTGTGTVTRPASAAGGKRTSPAVGGAGIRRPGAPRVPSAQHTSILKPASAKSAEPDPWYRRLGQRLPAARYIALILAGVLIVGGGAAFGITQLTKEDATSTSSPGKTPAAAKRDKKRQRASVAPGDVTVTVLNGTGVTGLARDTADRLERLGFQIGNKLTATETGQAESVVQFLPGATAEAKLVGAKLDIGQIEPADANTTAQAGPAKVIVVLGADKAPAPQQ